MNAWRGALCGLLLGSLGCTNFPTIEADQCGNGVLETGEDCDTLVSGGMKCRPPGVKHEECHYDCTTASDGTRPACPTDMGCDRDGLCKRGTSDFERVPQLLSSDGASWLSEVDFDGDQRNELVSTEPADQLGLGRFRLHYLDDDAKILETRTFPRFTTRPLARKIGGEDDKFADLIFSNGRIGVVPGRLDREWVPTAFSSYVVRDTGLRVVGVRDESVLGGVPIVSITTIKGKSGLYIPYLPQPGEDEPSQLQKRADLPRPVEELVGEPLVADLVEGEASPCSEVVLAFRDDSRLFVFDVCEPTEYLGLSEVAWRPAALAQVIELPDSLSVETKLMSGDVDGDGHRDVVFDRFGELYVVYGDGAGLVPDVVPLEVTVLGMQLPDGGMSGGMMPDQGFEPPPEIPVALGDFTGDGVADFVMPQRLLVSRHTDEGLVYVPSSDNRGEPWNLAEIADVNGNGFLDVVTASTSDSGFTFHNGTGSQNVIGARVPTRRPVRFLGVGDFDGDLIQDLAIVETGAAGSDKDTLSIAFGARDALPLPAKRIVELEGAQQLGDCRTGGMDTLFVSTSRDRNGPESTFTLFDGSPDRLPIATYSLVTFSVDQGIQDYSAASLAFGAFTHSKARDVMVLGADLFRRNEKEPFTQWLLPDIGGVGEPPQKLSMPGTTELSPVQVHGSQSGLAVASAAADLDDDKIDEVLWLMPQQDMLCALAIYDVDADSRSVIARPVVNLEAGCPEPELATADLDQDDDEDVLVLVGNVAVDQQHRIEVLWNDGKGRFSLDRRTTLAIGERDQIRAFSVLPETTRLAYVTDGALGIAELDPQTHTFSLPPALLELQNGRALAVANPNNDNLDDLVVADDNGIFMLRPVLEAIQK